MEITKILKAMADDTRFRILILLLQHNYCVRALSRKLELSESAISQHIKVLREAGLLIGVKKGYYMHYDVDRSTLHKLSSKIEELAAIERKFVILKTQGVNLLNGKCVIYKKVVISVLMKSRPFIVKIERKGV